MKKQFGLPLMLASALAFSACNSDDVAENGPKDIAALTDGGYVKMSINLPSRAANGGFKATDDQYGEVTLEDGLAKEYNVKDAILVLFQGDNEADAQFHSAYDISTSMQMDKNNEHITSTTKLVQKVNAGGDANPIPTGNKLYALVVLNNNGLFEVAGNNLIVKHVDDATKTLPTAGTSFTGTFAQFQALKATGGKPVFYTDDNTGILMMNAPLYTTTGGTAEPTGLTTLANVTAKVYKTAMEAQNEPGAEIFVERAVAKVTMAEDITTPELKGTEYKATNGLTASLVAWGLDYTNNISFLIHNASHATTSWTAYNEKGDGTGINYRFGGNTMVKTGYGFRAYWGVDPNYEATDGKVSSYTGGASNFDHVTDISELSTAKGAANPQYCMENTFNVKNMNEDQTTRAIVKVQLTPTAASTITMDADGSFYIVNGNKSQIFDEAKLKTFIFENFVKKCNTVYEASLTAKGVPTKADIEFTTPDTKSEMSVSTLKVTYTNGDIVDYTDATTGAVKEVNEALKKITKYVKGYAYYPIRIKHFGNGLTPWDATKHTQDNRYNNNSEKQFLGRYGVLRNNWYDLGINSISGVGSPVIPKAPDTPDDELESFISVRINVLSWAKRVQREDL